MKRIILMILICVPLIACKEGKKAGNGSDMKNGLGTMQNSTDNISLTGNYVDESYKDRNKGYDWVAVIVEENSDSSISISVRSRADKKKPTCTFDAKAYKTDENNYESVYDGKIIVYSFTENTITISAKNKEDENMLYFFCSGGATFAGTYPKINAPLDIEQVDKTSFSKVLNLQNIGFNVSSIEKNGVNTFSVFSFGLKEKDFNETFDIGGRHVIDAEVEDLNSDGSPELVVYTQSNTSDKKGNVHAFSVNNNKSMSMVYFQPTEANTQINAGYLGNDEFTLIETQLVQRFPIYNENDQMDKPTGGVRQISYKLVDGEAMRKFEVNQITNY